MEPRTDEVAYAVRAKVKMMTIIMIVWICVNVVSWGVFWWDSNLDRGCSRWKPFLRLT